MTMKTVRFLLLLCLHPLASLAFYTPFYTRYESGLSISRRTLLETSTILLTTTPEYKVATRPTAYRVDSTIPPTLQSVPNAQSQKLLLVNLGQGSGTDKKALLADSLNLNNILNKAVFGSADVISKSLGLSKDERRSGQGYASFVCFAMPMQTKAVDVDLLLSLVQDITAKRKGNTAIGLHFCPYSTQSNLDDFLQGKVDQRALEKVLSDAQVSDATLQLYAPLFKLAKDRNLDLIATAVDIEDLQTVRSAGLQNVNAERRSQYVLDPEGFIALTQDAKYKVYTDRSLLKSFEPINNKDSEGNFYAERILVHEAAASAVSKYAASRPESLVLLTAPVADLRFLQGVNGRIPRVCQKLEAKKVTNDAVTTILLNPTPEDTLSTSRYIRLEIGTGPDSLDYQSKLSDYIWFSSSPRVSLLPRLMK